MAGGTYEAGARVLPRLAGVTVGASTAAGAVGGMVEVVPPVRASIAKRADGSAGGRRSSHDPVPKEDVCPLVPDDHASVPVAALDASADVTL